MLFTANDLKEYVKIEINHSLERFNLHQEIDKYVAEKRQQTKKSENQEDITSIGYVIDFFQVIRQFNLSLPILRYSLDFSSLHNSQGDNEEIFNKLYSDLYNSYKVKIDNLLMVLIRNLYKLHGFSFPDGKTVAELEACLIYHIYDHIQVNIGKAYDGLRNNNINLINYVKDSDKEIFTDAIVRRFVSDIATPSENYDPQCSQRIIFNKQMRYNGEDRGNYWKKPIETLIEKDFSRDMKTIARQFLVQGKENKKVRNQYIVGFALLISTKSHFILHQCAANEFRYLSQHIEHADKGNEVVKYAKKIFTFTRLMAKYFPDIFDPENESQSKAIAKAIEIISYLRRGFAFEVLGEAERAFNDYSSAEKQASILRVGKDFGQSKEEFVKLYQKVTVPYIFSLKGELYRRNFTFYNAHQYFCNSINRFEEIDKKAVEEKDEAIKGLLDSSLRIVRIQISKGKTFLELGEFRKAFKWYIKALLDLFKVLELNLNEKSFTEILEYFEEIRLEPKMNKEKIFNKLSILIDELEIIINQGKVKINKYRVLFSELLNRIGFIIYIFNLPNYDIEYEEENSQIYNTIDNEYKKQERIDDREILKQDLCRDALAHKCLNFALDLNPKNCLANFNRLIFDLENPCGWHGGAASGVNDPDEEITIVDSLIPGEPRDILYRFIARAALATLRTMDPVFAKDKEKGIAKELLQKLLLYTDDFSSRNAELYKYLTREGKIKAEPDEYKLDEIRFHCLQRWSSINPAIPRPSAFKMKGGGYFITFQKNGIAIDPGLNFVENLYSEGFSIADVNYIITTHDHIDHIAEIDTIMSLHYKRSKIEVKKIDPLTLVLSPSVSSRYGFLVNSDPRLFNKMELTADGKRRIIFDNFAIEAKQVTHPDICSPIYSNSIGLKLVFDLGKNQEKFIIGITGDTKYWKKYPGDKDYSEDTIIEDFQDSDILIAHINSTPFRELKILCEITLGQLLQDSLKKIDDDFKNKPHSTMEAILNQLKFSLGYSIGQDFSEICGMEKDLKRLDGEHLFLHGLMRIYDKFSNYKNPISADPLKERLFIVAETSEEMGSYRHKVAMLLNKYYSDSPKCLTGDIGMTIRIKPADVGTGRNIEVRCSRCNLNNDYTSDDKFHSPKNINEVCLKWEEEGLVYYCRRHDPESVNRDFRDYGFTERIERYQPFKHVEIRIR